MRIAVILVIGVISWPLPAGDWPMWGRDPSRNMVAPAGEKNLPAEMGVGDHAKHLKWSVRLGSQTYGNPVAAAGRVIVGTNNEPPKDPRIQGDYGVLLCLDQATGKVVWQLASPKIGDADQDFEGTGIASPAAIDVGKRRVYLTTNRCEVLCLDLDGMSNGNDGPFKEEGKYVAAEGQAPVEPGEGGADILWRYDMRKELGVVPLFQTAGAVLLVGERLYVPTCNGHDPQNTRPAPEAPQLICLNKNTGKLLGRERSGISERLYFGNWSAASYGEVKMPDGKTQAMVFFGGGDGFCYGFDAAPTADGTLKELWRFDCNPPGHKATAAGKPIKYGNSKGPSEIIATPVFCDNRVYVAVGQEPTFGDGVGCLNCIDPTKAGDISATGKVWANTSIGRSLSTVAVTGDGLLFTAELSGKAYCMDAKTGETIWDHDTGAAVWGSFLIADGKGYLGNESGTLTVLAAKREKKVIGEAGLGGPIFSTPVVADGTIYVTTDKHLHAFGGK